MEGGIVIDTQYEIFTLGNEIRYTPLDNQNISYVNIDDDTDVATYLIDQGPLPEGYLPLPSYLYSFQYPVSEPSSVALAVMASLALAACGRRTVP